MSALALSPSRSKAISNPCKPIAHQGHTTSDTKSIFRILVTVVLVRYLETQVIPHVPGSVGDRPTGRGGRPANHLRFSQSSSALGASLAASARQVCPVRSVATIQAIDAGLVRWMFEMAIIPPSRCISAMSTSQLTSDLPTDRRRRGGSRPSQTRHHPETLPPRRSRESRPCGRSGAVRPAHYGTPAHALVS
jgi:hypothetical protein